jgi:hypothetical protein
VTKVLVGSRVSSAAPAVSSFPVEPGTRPRSALRFHSGSPPAGSSTIPVSRPGMASASASSAAATPSAVGRGALPGSAPSWGRAGGGTAMIT